MKTERECSTKQLKNLFFFSLCHAVRKANIEPAGAACRKKTCDSSSLADARRAARTQRPEATKRRSSSEQSRRAPSVDGSSSTDDVAHLVSAERAPPTPSTASGAVPPSCSQTASIVALHASHFAVYVTPAVVFEATN